MLEEPTVFRGQDLDADSCEILFNTRWNPKQAKAEPPLFHKKWWDYRTESAVISTYRFGHIFTEEVRRIIRAHIDPAPPVTTASGFVKDWYPIKSGDFFDPPTGSSVYWRRKIDSLIRARQLADKWGIPYPFYCRTAVRRIYFQEYLIFEHVKLPEPGLLCGVEMLEHILAAWIERIDSGIQCATHPRYRAENHPELQGERHQPPHPDLAAHDDWLVAQLKRKADPRFAIRNLVRDGWLRRSVAERHFGLARVAAALC